MNRYKIKQLPSIGLKNSSDFSKNHKYFMQLAKRCNCMCAGCSHLNNDFEVDYIGTKENLLKLIEKHYGGIENNPDIEFKRIKKDDYAYFFEDGVYPSEVD